MIKATVKYILILFIYLVSNQNSWSAPVDSTTLSPPSPGAVVPCNTSFYTTLQTNPPNEYFAINAGQPSSSPGYILALFNSGAPTNMCPNINYTVDVSYILQGANCGGGICCGFQDGMAVQNAILFNSAQACFRANTTIVFTDRGYWYYPNMYGPLQQHVAISSVGGSDGAWFMGGSVYIHYP